MSDHRWNFSLPLLTRELIAQAARRRTYVIRVLLALLASWLGLMLYQNQIRHIAHVANSGSLFGQGDVIFDALTWMQFIVIYLFLPMQCAGLLTEEKERDTLQLLLLTQLGPWKILWEKLLSRVVPMISLLLVCLPLQALAYGLGGVSAERIAISFGLLLLTLFQMGSLGLVASSFHRTTARATITTLGLVAATLFGPGLIGLIVIFAVDSVLGYSGTNELERNFTAAMAAVGLSPQQGLFPFFAALHYQLATRVGMANVSLFAGSAVLITCQTAGVLWLAHRWLWSHANLSGDIQPTRRLTWRERRAASRAKSSSVAANSSSDSPEIVPTSPLGPSAGSGLAGDNGSSFEPELSSQAQRELPHETQASTTSVTQPEESEDLPVSTPVAWRELRRNRSSLLSWLMILLPPITVGLTLAMAKGQFSGILVQVTCFISFWVLALLRTIVSSTASFCGERSRQTLDVLRTLPLSGAELVQQKLSGLWPIAKTYGLAILANSLCGVLLRLIQMNQQMGQSIYNRELGWEQVALYLANALLLPAIELPLIACLGCLAGLFIKGHQRAIWLMLGFVLTWMIGPPLLVAALNTLLNDYDRDATRWSLLCSPAVFPMLNEVGELEGLLPGPPWPSLITPTAQDRVLRTSILSAMYLGTHLVLLVAAWKACRFFANRRLGGPDPGEDSIVDVAPATETANHATGLAAPATPSGRDRLSALRARQADQPPMTPSTDDAAPLPGPPGLSTEVDLPAPHRPPGDDPGPTGA